MLYILWYELRGSKSEPGDKLLLQTFHSLALFRMHRLTCSPEQPWRLTVFFERMYRHHPKVRKSLRIFKNLSRRPTTSAYREIWPLQSERTRSPPCSVESPQTWDPHSHGMRCRRTYRGALGHKRRGRWRRHKRPLLSTFRPLWNGWVLPL